MSPFQPNADLHLFDPQFEAHKRNMVRIAGITGLLMLVITLAVLPEVLRLGLDRIWGLVVTALLTVISFAGAWISSRGRPYLAAGILVVTVLLLSTFVTVLFAQDQGIALSAIIIFVVSTIALYTLPQRWVGRVIAISVLVGLLNILIDFYLPNLGLANDPRYTNIIGVIVSIIYIFMILGRFNQLPLRTKLVVAFILISLVPVILLGIQSTVITRNNLTNQADTDLIETARTAAQAIDTTLANELIAIRTEAQIIDLADYLSLPASVRAGSPEETRASQILLALQRKNPVFVSSYAVLDENGIDVLDTFQNDIGINKSDRDYFRAAFAQGVPFLSPVRMSQTSMQPSIYFSAPIKSNDGGIIGILRSRYNASFLQNILNETARSGPDEFAVLVDNETYVRIADTGDQLLSFKAYGTLSDGEIKDLQTHLRLPPGSPMQVTAPEPQVLEGIRNLDKQSLFTAPSITFLGANTYAGGVKLRNANWSVLIQRKESSVLAPIQSQTRAISIVALLVIVLAAASGYMASRVLAQPLTQLSAVASDIASGNLNARAVSQTPDELGALAEAFNRMTSRLQDTLGSLERRVSERTADVEVARLMSERRAQELQAISDISRLISSEQRLETLLALITRLVSEKFDFYHVGIFFVDDTRRYAVLQAANSEGGQHMLARGHRLEVGQTGLVGYVAKTGKSRIALDVGEDAVYFDNPDLPQTRSEMALPLNVHGETIGVLDIQSTEPGVFTDTDAKTLSILADQIAIAISNARLFGQNQQALEELQSLYNQYLRQEWKTFVQNRKNVGYIHSAVSGKPLEVPLEAEEIQQALQDGKVVVLGKRDRSLPTMAIPVKLRGQTIGVLHIQAPTTNHTWNQDEVKLAQAIADRLALALDNARLLFVSQRQTAKEQKVSEVTAKIGASMNMRNVLQTAVEELGRALPGSEVVIQFQNEKNGSSPS
ncbi:MAG TPA: GAF domain-containing protein [Anaerolineales bacterium]|nr:GAF domain-containing protein [Anaerolineales bacterium]